MILLAQEDLYSWCGPEGHQITRDVVWFWDQGGHE